MMTGCKLAGFVCFTSATPPTLLGRGYRLALPLRVAAGSYTTIPDVALDNTDCIPLLTGNNATGAMTMNGAFIAAGGALVTMNANTVSATGVADGPTFQCIIFVVDANR